MIVNSETTTLISCEIIPTVKTNTKIQSHTHNKLMPIAVKILIFMLLLNAHKLEKTIKSNSTKKANHENTELSLLTRYPIMASNVADDVGKKYIINLTENDFKLNKLNNQAPDEKSFKIINTTQRGFFNKVFNLTTTFSIINYERSKYLLSSLLLKSTDFV